MRKPTTKTLTKIAPNPEMADHLARARQSLEKAIQLLDRGVHDCTACGLTIRHDFFQYQLAVTLEGFIDRLTRYEKPLRANPRVAKWCN